MGSYDDVREYIQESLDVAVRSGYGSVEDVLEQLEEQVRDEFREEDADTIDEEVQRWVELAHRELEAQRQIETTWVERTHNDRIDEAFTELRRRGIVALQDAGYTMSDGWDDVDEARADVDRAWGAVFFHRQDVERGVNNGGLLLAFGAFAEGARHEPESLRLARETCEVLAAHDVATEWNGTLGVRIAITPFEWRKRRWTRAPGS